MSEGVIMDSAFNKEKDYWLGKLSGEITKSYFPYDYLKLDGNHPQFEQIPFEIPAEISAVFIKMSNDSDIKLHMILLAAVTAFLHKFTGNDDLIVGTPIYRQNVAGEFINTVLAIRNPVAPNTSFKELLIELRKTVIEAVEHQNYPLEKLIYLLNIPIVDNEFPLFDTMVLLNNIQERGYIKDVHCNTMFCFNRNERQIDGVLEYNAQLYKKSAVERIIAQFINLIQKVPANMDEPLSRIDLLSDDERAKILIDFNNTCVLFPDDKTIGELFEKQAAKYPDKIAVSFTSDLTGIHHELMAENSGAGWAEKIANICFQKRPGIRCSNNAIVWELITDAAEKDEWTLLETFQQNYVLMNPFMVSVFHCFNGENNLQSIFAKIAERKSDMAIRTVRWEIFDKPAIVNQESAPSDNFESFIRLIKTLYQNNFIELAGYNSASTNPEIIAWNCGPGSNPNHGATIRQVPAASSHSILLLGDTLGTASTGLLYLASYLRRNGVDAYCQWNNWDRDIASLKCNIRGMLDRVQPQIVGVSMKWFPHMARVLEICKIVKEYSVNIRVVLGGNTATYYYQELIRYPWIDDIILGDGEVPLLKICKNEDNIPNHVYLKDGEIMVNPVSYVQDTTNSKDIYLSHLDEIFIGKNDPFYAPEFYINTGKGCSENCFYCAGCRDTQKSTFNRTQPFMRGIEEVRKDLQAARNYTGRFMFDFDLPSYESCDYHRKIWDGIDLSGHFCSFYFWKLPSFDFVRLVSETFKYSRLSIDLCSLSERHRLQLASLHLIKPQPTDAEVFALLSECNKYPNIEVAITTIDGLPYFVDEDTQCINEMFSHIVNHYSCFKGVYWERLHAQPGAPLVERSEQLNVTSEAVEFKDFLHFSELSFREKYYPNLDNLHYPAIYPKGENQVGKHHYLEIGAMIKQFEHRKNSFQFSEHLTYTELNRKSNQLARVLIEKGIRPDDLVGIMAERSLEMVIGILGILKAGGAYLPLDPEYPETRIKYMIEDSQVKIILTQRHLTSKVEFNGDLVLIDSTETLYQGDDSNLGFRSRSENLAYTIYTSGSTGQPKGVAIEHRGVANLKTFFEIRLGVSSKDRIIQFAPFSFDASVWEMCMSLLTGASLFLVSKDIINDSFKFEDFLNQNEITIATLPPPFLASLNPERIHSLRKVIVAGSASTTELLNNWVDRVEYFDAYGPTETTVCATAWKSGTEKVNENLVPIGSPITNTQVYIVDKNLKLQPIGLVGEICVSGVGLARNYLNKPELTAKKFVDNPFAPGRKMYRTGDLGRWRPDGNIEFLGRMDNQVKVRGHRIEIGEIEFQLRQYPNLKDVIITGIPDEIGDMVLAAYFVAVKELSVQELKEYLAKSIPSYMIPTFFVQLDQLPLTMNGKIDKKALPKPQKNIKLNRDFVPPQNDTELKMASIWNELLGIDKIGLNDSFFELGGDSLKATLLVGRIHKELNMEISLLDIFKSPALKEMAASLKPYGDSVEELAEIEKLLTEIEELPEEQADETIGRK